MRIFYLLLLLVSLTEVLNARDDVFRGKNVGDVVKGKNAAYKVVDEAYFNYFILMRNVNARDTVRPEGADLFSDRVSDLLNKIVYEQLTSGELSRFEKLYKDTVSYTPAGGLLIYCFLDEDFNVREVNFAFLRESTFWLDLPVDRFYEMEKRLKKIKLTPEEREDLEQAKNDGNPRCCWGFFPDRLYPHLLSSSYTLKSESRFPGENK